MDPAEMEVEEKGNEDYCLDAELADCRRTKEST